MLLLLHLQANITNKPTPKETVNPPGKLSHPNTANVDSFPPLTVPFFTPLRKHATVTFSPARGSDRGIKQRERELNGVMVPRSRLLFPHHIPTHRERALKTNNCCLGEPVFAKKLMVG